MSISISCWRESVLLHRFAPFLVADCKFGFHCSRADLSFSSRTAGHDHCHGSGEEEAGCGCRRRFGIA